MSELFTVAKKGNLEEVKQHVEAGADVNYRQDWWLDTSLIVASANGHHEVVNYLLKHEAKVNVMCCQGLSALTYACKYNHKDIAFPLLIYDADPSIVCNYGQTAKDYARSNGWNFEEMEREAFAKSQHLRIEQLLNCAMHEEVKGNCAIHEDEESGKKRKREADGEEGVKKEEDLFLKELMKHVNGSDSFLTENVIPLLYEIEKEEGSEDIKNKSNIP